MRSVLILRVEDTEGRGPYCNPATEKYMDHDEDDKHPMLHNDSDYLTSCDTYSLYSDRARYGFNSTRQLHSWFSPKELGLLFKNGYTLKYYRVAEAYITTAGHQVLFDMKGVLK